jgi:argininosuccinate synthase
MEEIRSRALATGACEAVVDELSEPFVRDFVFPALRANAVYEGCYLLGTSLARPLIAARQLAVAHEHGADTVAHGATGKGNDQVRFELTCLALDPHIKILAPWRDWDMKSRGDLIDYASRNGIQVPVTKDKPYSMDPNLFHTSYEGGVLEDPWAEPPQDMFRMTVSPEEAPDRTRRIEIEFEQGNPVAVDGEKMSPAQLLAHLNQVGGENGIGRVDMVENRFVGMKSRGVYETPGGTLLHRAHRAVESLTLDREVMFLLDSLVPQYARMVYNGFWFSPERELMQGMIDEAQRAVCGTARLKLYKGNAEVVGRKSDRSMYREDFATFEEDEVYRQKDAEGFIRLNALRLRIRNMVEGARKP